MSAPHRISIALVGFSILALSVAQPTFAQIKPGVTQSAARTANITGTVTRSNDTPVAGADISLKGATILTTKSDARGGFNFTSVPWGTYEIVVTSQFGTASQTLTLNQDVTVAIQYQLPTSLRTIAHVSTSGAGAHINITSSSIYSVSPSDYAFEGNSTWDHLFSQIPGVTLSGGGFPSDYADNPNPRAGLVPTINGALSYETSTLLDGMPIAGLNAGQGFDVSTLPMNGFESTDIVRGPGSEAPSIVDSIGGSFVLHAPGQVSSDNWELAASNDPYGGSFWNARAAWRFGRLSATFAYGANVSPGPLGSATNYLYPFTYFSPTEINGIPVQSSPSSFLGDARYEYDPECYCTASTTLLTRMPGVTGWTRHDGSGDLTYAITPSIIAEVFFAGSSAVTFGNGWAFPEIRVDFAPQSATPAYTGNIMPSPSGQFSYDLLEGLSSPTNPYTISNDLWEEKVTAAIGQGIFRVAAVQDNSFNFDNGQYSFPSGFYQLWGTADLGSTSPGAPTAFNGSFAHVTFASDWLNPEGYWSNNRDYLASYAVQIGSASSIGASYTTSYYNYPSLYDIFCSGVPCYQYALSSANAETTREARIHFATDVSDKLSLGLSWYFASGHYHFQEPGSPTSSLNFSPVGPWVNRTFPYDAPRFGAVWQANQNISVRVAAGGGYALPISGYLTSTPLSCFPTNFPPQCIQGGANPSLKPETSVGFDLGSDGRVDRNTVISLDLYHTNLYGAYYSETTVVPASVCGAPCGGLPLYTSTFNNLTESRMEGVNLEAHRDVPSGLYWTGNLGLTRGFVVRVPSGFYNNPEVPCKNCVNTGIIPGANYNYFAGDTGTIPYSTAYAELGWRWRPGTFFGFAGTYYGPNNPYYTPKAFAEVDAHAGYAINSRVSLLVTLTNVTGVYDQSFLLSSPTYLTPVVHGAGLPPFEPNIASYGPRAITVTTAVQGGP